MKPLLTVLNTDPQKDMSLQELVPLLADTFELNEEERTRLLPSGKQALFNNRVGWARTYLTKAGLLTITRRAHSIITERGQRALQDLNTNINTQYLKQFDEFVAFIQKSNQATDSTQADEAHSNQKDSQITPDEALREAYTEINDTLAAELLDRTRSASPAFFEGLLIELLIAMGYGGNGSVDKLGKSRDGGVDGVINQDLLGVDQIYVQAKRYAANNNIGEGHIRDFAGALDKHKAVKGIFFTTSNFTAPARQAIKELSLKIILVNGIELAQLMLRYNIGCRKEQTLHIKKIDEDFFEQN